MVSSCPLCAALITVPDQMAGSLATCPVCQQQIRCPLLPAELEGPVAIPQMTLPEIEESQSIGPVVVHRPDPEAQVPIGWVIAGIVSVVFCLLGILLASLPKVDPSDPAKSPTKQAAAPVQKAR